MHAAMREATPDLIIHMAAQTVVLEGYRSPRETFDINTVGTACLLDGVRGLDKPCSVIVVSSDKCYENREQVWGYRESDAFGSPDPYGASKGSTEIVVQSYRSSFFPEEKISEHGVKLASARAGNVIGGGDWTADALLVDLIAAISQNKPAHIRNPGAYRPWQHVLSCLSGYLTLADRLLSSDDPTYCSGWNFGPVPGNELPVRDIVERFLSVWGHGSWQDCSDPEQPHESTILRLTIDKALWQLHWRPVWGIDEALQHTVDWYKHYFTDSAHNMRDFSLGQIEVFERAYRSAHGLTR